jgi:hypothetical protein
MQAALFPVICTRIKPPPTTAAADFIGVDESTTHRWLCKGQSRHTDVPATEWICSHLAQACGLPVPPFAVVERFDQPGVPYFGSQWQGGSIPFVEAMNRISNGGVFARTHAADLVVHNTDRHRDNFLYLELAGDVVARVIDFSHALLVAGWPLPPLPMAAHSNTMLHLPLLLAQNRAPYSKPLEVLEVLAGLPDEWLRDTVLATMPAAWLTRERQVQLRQWWVSAARRGRIQSAQYALP